MPNSTVKDVVRMACVLTMLGITPVKATNHIRVSVPNAQKVGEGRLSYLLWDIYDATLYAPEGKWEANKPFALKLSYLRTLDGEKIADRSAEEMRNQGFTDEVKLAAWHEQMSKIFPDVDEGVSLTGVYTEDKSAVFYKDDVEIGRINDPEFSEAFFGIWLNEETTAPSLRQKLLGAT